MLRIGLTGGIGAGKSTASRRFGELGAVVIDHDVLARRVVEPGTAGLVDIVKEFGPGVLNGKELDRAALGALVFGNEPARQRLNAIVHPYVTAAADAADRAARAAGERVVVHDIPLLVETGQGEDFDLVVCVYAPGLQHSRGYTRDEAMARIAAQATDEEREAASDVVLQGGGAPEELWAQIDELWRNTVPAS